MWLLGLLVGLVLGASLGRGEGAVVGMILGASLGAMAGQMLKLRKRSSEVDALRQRIDTVFSYLEDIHHRLERLEQAKPLPEQNSVGAEAPTPVAAAAALMTAQGFEQHVRPPAPAPDIVLPFAAESSAPLPSQDLAVPPVNLVKTPAVEPLPLLPELAELPQALPPEPVAASPAADLRAAVDEIAAVAAEIAAHPVLEPTPAPAPSAVPEHPVWSQPQHPQPQPEETTVAPSGWWQRFLEANFLAKIGVVLLFIGIASALKYAVEHTHFPLELRLFLVGAASAGMVWFGWRERTRRRMFGLALQGGGFAVAYLLVYFMLKGHTPPLIEVLPAFVLFAALGVGCMVLSLRQDGVSLAVLGLSGAFLAPILASTGSGNHVALFSYYALLNTFVLGIAWFKTWRCLNLAGFLFTFIIGSVWAARAYTPEKFASTEPFLLLFFVMYTVVPILFSANRRPSDGRAARLDGFLLFAVPLAAALLQTPMVADFEYGLAWSACGAGLYYQGLALALHASKRAELRQLRDLQVGIGLLLLTVAVPAAYGAQPTVALWALVGVGLYGVGQAQKHVLSRVAGLLLQPLAAIWWVAHFGEMAHTPVWFNTWFGAGITLVLAWTVLAVLMRRRGDATDYLAANPLLLLALSLAQVLLVDQAVRAADPGLHGLTGYMVVVCVAMALGRTLKWPTPHHALLALPLAMLFCPFAFEESLTLGYELGSWLALPLLAAALNFLNDAAATDDRIDPGAYVLAALALLATPLVFEADYALPLLTLTGLASLRAGLVRQRPALELAAMAAQGLAAAALLAYQQQLPADQPGDLLFNTFALGSLLLTLCGGVSAWLIHRAQRDETAPAATGKTAYLLWAALWWFVGGLHEINTFAPPELRLAWMTGFVAVSCAVLEWFGRRTGWQAVRRFTWLLPALSAALCVARVGGHPLADGLQYALPLTWVVYAWSLYRQEQDDLVEGAVYRHGLFAASVIATLSLEAWWWTKQWSVPGSDWRVFGRLLVPVAAILLIQATLRRCWPAANHPRLYRALAGGLIIWVGFWMLLWLLENLGTGRDGLPSILDLLLLVLLGAVYFWRDAQDEQPNWRMRVLVGAVFLWCSAAVVRLVAGIDHSPFSGPAAVLRSLPVQVTWSIMWTAAAAALMIHSSRRLHRPEWFLGLGLLAITGAKLFFIDLTGLGTLGRALSFIGVSLFVLATSYFAPMPPSVAAAEEGKR